MLKNWYFVVSLNGYTLNEIGFQWLNIFESETEKTTITGLEPGPKSWPNWLKSAKTVIFI